MSALPRRWIVAAALLAGCKSPPPPPSPDPVDAPAPLPSLTASTPRASSPAPAPSPTADAAPPSDAGAVTRSGAYVGLRVGLFIPELHKATTLPPDLVFLGALELGVRRDANQMLVARRSRDLVLLLMNDDGVVIDVAEARGVAEKHQMAAGCHDASWAFVDAALVPTTCDKDPVTDRVWNVQKGKIVPSKRWVTCTCVIP
jgi:hypothetical protein